MFTGTRQGVMGLFDMWRVAIAVSAIFFCLAAGWLVWKVYHQMNTPIDLLVIETGR